MIDLGQPFNQYFTTTTVITKRLQQALDEHLLDSTDLAAFTLRALNVNQRVRDEVVRLNAAEIHVFGDSDVYIQAAADMESLRLEIERVIEQYAALNPSPGKKVV